MWFTLSLLGRYGCFVCVGQNISHCLITIMRSMYLRVPYFSDPSMSTPNMFKTSFFEKFPDQSHLSLGFVAPPSKHFPPYHTMCTHYPRDYTDCKCTIGTTVLYVWLFYFWQVGLLRSAVTHCKMDSLDFKTMCWQMTCAPLLHVHLRKLARKV